jgi:hypothetical protein
MNLWNDYNLNLPPGGAQLINYLEALGQMDKATMAEAMVSLGASKDTEKAMMTIHNMVRFNVVGETKEGKLYLLTQGLPKAPFAKLLLYVVSKLARGDVNLHHMKKPAALAYTVTGQEGTVFEISIWRPEQERDRDVYLEYKGLSKVTKPVLIMLEGEEKVTPTMVKKLFSERLDLIVVVCNKGEQPIFFVDGAMLKETKRPPKKKAEEAESSGEMGETSEK